jgi:histone deacetylase complex regulatory component SIN3
MADDPVQYLHLVRETLAHEDYLSFCKIMADYKSNRSGIEDTVKDTLQIFGDNVQLKKGFQIFLPQDYSLDSVDDAQFDGLHDQTLVDLESATEMDGLLRQRVQSSNLKFFLVCTGIWISVFSLVIYGFIRFIII